MDDDLRAVPVAAPVRVRPGPHQHGGVQGHSAGQGIRQGHGSPMAQPSAQVVDDLGYGTLHVHGRAAHIGACGLGGVRRLRQPDVERDAGAQAEFADGIDPALHRLRKATADGQGRTS
ncbi:hypothetical protein G6F31_020289 [Rhizopus arrhizus]|nr:hypothetical protein G6F31_020289 [Rhizopus arrhizus]